MDVFAPEILSDDDANDHERLGALRQDPAVEITDHRSMLAGQLADLYPTTGHDHSQEPGRWVYYPWRRTLIGILGPSSFHRLRLDRNRNKITSDEQEYFGHLRIGVIGLSVGHAIAYTLAHEGLCGHLKLADFDSLELSNLNRIPASVLDLGLNKAVVAARRIAELNPYLPIEVYRSGLQDSNIEAFLDGVDILIEECDSLDMKVQVREHARRRRIPVLMETSDRGLFDVERFDLEPDRPLFHGLLGRIEAQSLRSLSMTDKAPHVMRILEGSALSARMAASMVEIERTVGSWPQLAGDVQLGGATVAAAVRRFGLERQRLRYQQTDHSDDEANLSSGRIRIDLDRHLSRLDPEPLLGPAPITATATAENAPIFVTDPREAIALAIRRAPSGGNSQPWRIGIHPTQVDIILDPLRQVCMDVQFRGSYVAIGAAEFNARVAAARFGVLGSTELCPPDAESRVVARISLGTNHDAQLDKLYEAMFARASNRSQGTRSAFDPSTMAALADSVRPEGGSLTLIPDEDGLDRLGGVLAASDRIRYLAPNLHHEMFSELRWPGDADQDLGIDVRTLGLDAADLAKLGVASRSDVMDYLARWQGGQALGDNTYDRVVSSSAIAIVSVAGDDPGDYLRGGAAVERFWITACSLGLGVYPMSPVFLYARSPSDLLGLSPEYSSELASLQQDMDDIIGSTCNQAPVLMLRLVHQPGAAQRSRRRDIAGLLVQAGASTDD
ncbi:MAG TPA: Rv1355c family protein [Nakamurella sp.]